MKTWIITDTHFSDFHLVDSLYRPKDFEARIIDNLKKYLAEDDLLIHLGDVGYYMNKKKMRELLDSIKCKKKILVRGNHDRTRTHTWWMEAGFDFSCDAFVLGNTLFTHEPSTLGCRYKNGNVHGHFHNAPLYKWEYNTNCWNKFLSLEDERVNYSPVLLKKIDKFVTITEHIADINLDHYVGNKEEDYLINAVERSGVTLHIPID